MSSSSLLLRSFKSTATQVWKSNSRITTQGPITINTSALNTKNFLRGFRNTNSNMGVHNIANKAEFDAALKDNKVVILDAFATWCGPCKVIAPTVAKFSEQYPKAHFVKIDVDEVPDVAQELSIRAMPTFIVFKDGQKVEEVVGANPKALETAISTYALE